MVCYHCQQPGHMRRDYPQRQGSQGFGTTQSQSIVGQERIQYVPPQHGTGQRGQSQFQGATRAPHISQAGPRGQSMGRGRGRGPQAGTSRVQGRVYSITPQAKSADHPIIHGTFLLSVTSRFPVRPDWQIQTGFRDARPYTRTLYLIFFLKANWNLWVWPTSYNRIKMS